MLESSPVFACDTTRAALRRPRLSRLRTHQETRRAARHLGRGSARSGWPLGSFALRAGPHGRRGRRGRPGRVRRDLSRAEPVRSAPLFHPTRRRLAAAPAGNRRGALDSTPSRARRTVGEGHSCPSTAGTGSRGSSSFECMRGLARTVIARSTRAPRVRRSSPSTRRWDTRSLPAGAVTSSLFGDAEDVEAVVREDRVARHRARPLRREEDGDIAHLVLRDVAAQRSLLDHQVASL